MNKKIIIFVLTICMNLILVTGCNDSNPEEDIPELKIYIINESTSTLKNIYWMSDVLSGVLNIDVPSHTEQNIIIDILPGEVFQLMITTSDPDQYVKWVDVKSPYGDLYLIHLEFNVKLFESCLLNAGFLDNGSISMSPVYSVENTLPSI